MGVYDIIVFEGPYCGEKTSVHTKMFGCNMKNYKVGLKIKWTEKTPNKMNNYAILFKDVCHKCGKKAVMIVKNDIIKEIIKLEDLDKFMPYKYNFITERPFGDFFYEVVNKEVQTQW